MKIAVIQIGSHHFACPSVQCATKLVDLLSKVVHVRRKYGDGMMTYIPVIDEGDLSLEVELTLIDQALIEKPLSRIPKARRLGPGEPLLPPIL